MIQVALDWNCVIDLEEGRPCVPHIRQLHAWHDQGKVALCISAPSRLENPRSPDRISIGEEEWEEKMRSVGLAGIELRPARLRTFLGEDGSHLFDDHLEHLIRQEIHAILFPTIDYYYDDYCHRLGVEPIRLNGFLNLSEAHQAANEKQRRITKKWNNAKCDALSLHAYSTWSGPDDLFVTSDEDDFIENRDRLYQPFHLSRTVVAPPPGSSSPYPVGTILTEQVQTIVLSGAIRGHIMSPQEAVEYLQQQLEKESNQ